MSDEKRVSPRASRSKEDEELNYDSIATGEAPVDRYDVVVPGDTARYLEQPDFASAPPPRQSEGIDRRAADDAEVGKEAAAGEQETGLTPGPRTVDDDASRAHGASELSDAGGESRGLPQDEFGERDALSVDPLSGLPENDGSASPLEIQSGGTAASTVVEPRGAASGGQGLGGLVRDLVDDVVDTVTEIVPTVLNAVGLSAAENSALGTVVATLSATGTNAGSVVYSLLNDPSGNFLVVGDKVLISPAANLDYETATSHDVVVRGVDAAGDIVTQTFTIDITDTNEFSVSAVTDADAAANIVSEAASAGDTIGLVAQAHDGDGSDSVFYTVDDPRFTIDADGTVRVAPGASFDAETEPAITVTITATSTDGSTSNQSFAVAVGDVNESAIGAVSDSDGGANAVSENAAVGTTVGITAVATDADASDSVTYSLSDNAGGLFAIDANTGVVTVAGAIDREAAASYDIDVVATSSDGSTSTQTYTINIDDQNEFSVSAPADTDASANSVNENVAAGTVVGITALASDADATNNTVTYSLSDDAGGLFAIDANTGVVTVAGAIDRETAASYDIEVTATSTDGSTAAQSFTININDLNETAISPVTDNDGAANQVSEAAAVGTAVGVTALAMDADATNNGVTYSLSSNPGGFFAIDANTGVVTVANALDFETAASHTIEVTATSTDGSTSAQTFTINVADANESGVGAISDSDGTANSVDENSAIGTTVGITALATDADGSDTVTYSLSDDAGGLFAIDANTGVVTVAGAIDRETAASYDIEVTATSSDGSTSTQGYTINVNDIDEFDVSTPTDADAAANAVAENAANGTVVGVTASAADGDATNNGVTYSLVDGGGNPVVGGPFAVDANSGVVTVADNSQLDYESATTQTIYVKATSADGSEATESFVINLTDANESGVGAISDSDGAANAVDENVAVGTTVGVTAFASDADGSDTVTYSLSDDAGGLFAIDANTGVVTVAGAIDRETAASYDIEVTATSSDGSSQAQTFTIAVNDIDEFNVSATSDNDGAANQVSEAAAVGTAVGVTALATDADATNNGVTYSLSSNPGGFFAIDANTGVVTVANALDYESGMQHTIEVTSTSADGSTSTQSFAIDVTDFDEADVGAVSDSDGTANSVDENSAIGTTVGITAFASDADGSDTVTYSLSDDAGGLFAIDANTGVVTVAGAIDRETAASYDIEVTATSSDGSTSAQSYTINVNDIDEFDVSTPTDADAAANSVAENAANGTVVGVTASAADGDATNNGVTYSLVDGGGNPVAGGPFAVDANSGVVTVADGSQLDYESATTQTIYVKATSADGSEATESFVINLTDADEADVGAISDSDGTANSVDENSAVGTTVGVTAFASDADGSDTVTYSLSDDAGGLFAIDANTGVVTVAGAIDRETAASYDIEVTATSSDGSTSTQTYTVNVNDIDEFDVSTPTDADAAANSVAENAANGTVVGVTASAADGDATNNGVTYSLVDGGGNPVAGGPFAVDANSGVVTVADNSQLDYESATTQTIYVKATSADGSEATESFVINLTDADEADVGAVSDSDGTANSVDENSAVGTTVGITALATDADGSDTVTYSLSDDAGGLFAIDANTGVVTVAGAIDREAAASYDIEVTATSSDGSTSTQDYTVNVNDIDEFDVSAPSDSDAAANTVVDDAANGTVVGVTASAADGDATNNGVTYSLVDGGGNPVAGGPFAVDANSGVVTVADNSQLDYDTASSQTIYVKATSADGSEATQSFVIDVTSGNEAPTDIIVDQNNGITLNTDGGNNSYLSVTDSGDIVGGLTEMTIEVEFSSTLSTGNDMPIFSYHAGGASDEIELGINNDGNGNELYLEIGGEVAGPIVGYDAAQLLDGANHQVSVTWDNTSGSWNVFVDGTSVASGSGIATGHTIASGGTIVLGQEQDTNGGGFDNTQIFEGTYHDVRIFNDVRTAQEISDNALKEISTGEAGLAAYWQMDDLSGGVTTDSVSGNDLTVANVSGAGWNASTPTLNTAISETAAAGTVVATLDTVDADSGDSHTYTITNDPSNSFEIVGDEIRVKAGASLDFENQSSYELTIQSTDSGGDAISENITIDVTNVFDEGPTNINFTGNADLTISGGGSSGGLILNDSGATNEYALKSGFSGFPTNDMTFEMSFSMESAAHEQVLVSYATSGEANEFTVVYHTNDTLEVIFDGDSIILNPGIDLADGSRHTISLVYEDDDNEVWLYVDGSLASYSNDISGGTELSSGGTLIFGQEQDSVGGSFDSGQIFVGEIYEARIWNDKRSASEISNNWDEALSDPGSAGNLVSNWQFENGTANDLRSTNHLSLQNGAELESGDGTIAAGSVVADVSSVVDADAGDHFSFALTDDAGGKFSIDADSGEITLVAEHDASSVYSDTVTVQVTDAGGNSFSETLGIQLGNNDAQTINGTSNDDVMYGFEGADTLNGGAGDDTLYGDSGDHSGPSLILNASGTDDIASVSNVTDFPTTQISAEVRFAADSIPGVDATLLSYYSDSSPDAFTLYLRNSPDEISVEFGNTIYSTGVSASALLDGAEHTVSVTWDSATGALNIYVDGTSQYSGTVAQGYTIPTGGTLAIGQEQDSLGGGYDSNQAFLGTIDEVRIFDDVRTAQEISDNYQQPIADPANEQGLVSNWQFNTDEGGTVTDLAGNNDLTLSNGASVGWEDASNNDTLNGGDGNDTLVGGAGADVMDGGAGIDTVDYSDSEGGVTVLLENVDATGINGDYVSALAGGHGGEAEGDSYTSIESVVGSDYNDAVYGASTGTAAYLGAGDDVFDNSEVGTGMDYVDGGSGNDQIWTGAGNDWVIGGEGNDTLHGEDGSDLFTFQMGDGADTVHGGAGGGWTDTIQLQDALGGNNLGTYGTDWTIALSEGSITGSDANSFTLSDDADGTINLSDGSSVQFFDIERIEF